MEDNGKKKRSPYFKISVYVFCVGALLLLFNRLLDSMGDLFAWVRTAWSTALTTMMPFLISIVLAYLFRPLVEKLMGLIARLEPASGRRRALDAVRRRLVKSRRFVAACVLYILVVALLVVTLAYVVPTTVMNVIELVQNMPGYVSALLEWVNDNVTNNAEIPPQVRQAVDAAVQMLNSSLTALLKDAVSMIPALLRQVYAISAMSLNVLLAIVLSFYLVCDDGRMFASVTKWLGTRLGPRRSARFFGFLNDLDFMFSKYLVGRLFESVVVAVLCFVVLVALKLPYNTLLAALYGFTNMIPYVGPVVGLVPVVCVALFRSPATALLAALLLTLVQGFDAWVLSPKVLGDSMGLNPFWVIFALVIGGALFGVVGLLLSTPVMGVLMRMLERNVARRTDVRESMQTPSR